MRDSARELIKQDIDPQQDKIEQAQKKQADLDSTLRNAAKKWFSIENSKVIQKGR